MHLMFLNKLDIKMILALLCVVLSCILCFFLWRNSSLKEDLFLKDLELQQANLNLQELSLALEKQNQALKELRVQKTKVDNKALREIVLKDSSCEAQLRGYKQIFKELGK